MFLHDNCEQISFIIFFAFLKKEEMRSGTHFTQQNVFLLFTVVVTKHVWPYFQSRFPKTSSGRVSSSRRGISLARATASPESRVFHSPWRKSCHQAQNYAQNYATTMTLPSLSPSVESPSNNAVTRANNTPPPFPRPLPTRPAPTIASAGCVSRVRLRALPPK